MLNSVSVQGVCAWMVGRSVGRLGRVGVAGWSVGRSVGWVVFVCLGGRSVGRSVGSFLCGWVVGRSVGWVGRRLLGCTALVGWFGKLLSWLVYSSFVRLHKNNINARSYHARAC